MLSVGSRADVRKGVGLGAELEEMEDNELEEGEAFSDQEEGAAAVDPDAYSYIDEKLQNVLGHFQKDFEGTVCVENLGAKFGVYGSFLPVQPRSPTITTQPRSPWKPANNDAAKSPANVQSEASCQNYAIVSKSISSSKSKYIAQALEKAPKKKQRRSRQSSLECSPNRSINEDNLKTLKVRIKVGSESATTRSHADICNDSGFRNPSSSPDISPFEGISLEARDNSRGSPFALFQFYSCFCAPRLVSCLLSPLPEYLSRVMEKGTIYCRDHCMDGVISVNFPKDHSAKDRKHVEKNIQTRETKSSNGKNDRNNTTSTCKKETTIDPSKGKDPVLSIHATTVVPKRGRENAEGHSANRVVKVAESGKVSCGINESKEPPKLTNEMPLDVPEDDVSRSDLALSKGNTTLIPCSGVKIAQHIKLDNASDDLSLDHKIAHKNNSDRCNNHSLVVSEVKLGPKSHNVTLTETTKPKTSQIATTTDATVKILHEKGKSSGHESKSKGVIDGDTSVGTIKEGAGVVSRMPLKDRKKGLHPIAEMSDGKISNQKSVEEPNRSSNDTGLPSSQHGEGKSGIPGRVNKMVPGEIKLNITKHGSAGKHKDRTGNKVIDTSSASGASDKQLQVPSQGNNCSASDKVPGTVALDHWVCCDKCERWRLLPRYINPNELPKKWLCSMLTWLPEMNSCSFTENETAAALYGPYDLPLPDSQIAKGGHYEESTSGLKVVDTQHQLPTSDRMHFDSRDQSKKRSVPRNASEGHRQPTSGRTTTPCKDALATSSKIRSLTEVNGCHRDLDIHSKSVPQCSRKSVDFNEEKVNHKRKDNQVVDGYKEEGDLLRQKKKNSKPKDKGDFTENEPMASKKIKLNDSLTIYDQSDHELGKSYTAAKELGHDMLVNSCTSKDLKFELDGQERKSKSSVNVVNAELLDHDTSFNDGSLDNTKKRKNKQSHKCSNSHRSDENQIINLHEKEKRAKRCKPDEEKKCTPTFQQTLGKSSSVTRTPLSSSRDQLLIGMEDGQEDIGKVQLNRRNVDGFDNAKREFGHALNSSVATSSSSKISGSHKSKTDMERRDSPVESVSSSPLRSSSAIKSDVKSSRRKMSNRGCLSTGSPERHLHQKTHTLSEETTLKRKISSCQTGSLEINRRNQGMEIKHFPESNSNAKYRLFANIFGSTDDEASPSHDDIEVKPGAEPHAEQTGRNSEKPKGKDDVNSQEKHQTEKLTKDVQNSTLRSKEKQAISETNSKSKNKTSNLFGHQDDLVSTEKCLGDSNCNGHGVSCQDLENEHIHPLKDWKKNVVNSEGKADNRSRSKMQVNMDTINLQSNKPKVLNQSARGSGIVSSEGGSTYHEDGQDLKIRKEKSSQKLPLPRTEKFETTPGKVTPELTSVPACMKEDMQIQPYTGDPSVKRTGYEPVPMNAGNGDQSRMNKQPRKLDNQNGSHVSHSKHVTPNSADLPASSRKGSSAQYVIREATNLKHTANRLKNEGLELDSTGLYFQAALKFLYGASLLELSESEGAKQGNMPSSIQMYSQTAKLCEFCAHAYVREKELAAVALAYKCTEVANLKVVYSMHSGALKDCLALQSAMPIGESPSSSASDVDNPNNQAKLNKVALVRATNSPQVGNQIIAARNRSNFDQLLTFAGYVNSAMDASKRALDAFSAFAAANGGQNLDGMQAVKRVLDSSFHDVEGLLRLVRQSMEFITR